MSGSPRCWRIAARDWTLRTRPSLLNRRALDSVVVMRTITQEEAIAMRHALKEIASYYNPAVDQSSPGQGAARRAREALEELGLFYEADVRGPKSASLRTMV